MRIKASGGHASAPHRSSNALEAAAAVVESLRGFPQGILGPLEPCALVPTILRAGSASNVIPDSAEIWYGVRTFLLPDSRRAFHGALQRKVMAVLSAFPGISATVEPIEGHPVLRNDVHMFSFAQEALRKAGCCAGSSACLPNWTDVFCRVAS